jgi:hypothetical protein
VHVEVGRELVERVGDQLLLPVPAPIDRVPPDAGAVRDRVDPRALKAALGEQLEGGLDDRRTRCGPAGATGRARSSFGTLWYRNIVTYENV